MLFSFCRADKSRRNSDVITNACGSRIFNPYLAPPIKAAKIECISSTAIDIIDDDELYPSATIISHNFFFFDRNSQPGVQFKKQEIYIIIMLLMDGCFSSSLMMMMMLDSHHESSDKPPVFQLLCLCHPLWCRENCAKKDVPCMTSGRQTNDRILQISRTAILTARDRRPLDRNVGKRNRETADNRSNTKKDIFQL